MKHDNERLIASYLKTPAGNKKLEQAMFPNGIKGRIDDLINQQRERTLRRQQLNREPNG